MTAAVRTLLAVLAGLCTWGSAGAAGELQALVRQALDEGHAEGRIDDRIARHVVAITGSSKPVYAVVRRDDVLPTGCGTVSITLEQDGVRALDGRRGPLALPLPRLNLCADGTQAAGPPAKTTTVPDKRGGHLQ